jgi:hypothetical protein
LTALPSAATIMAAARRVSWPCIPAESWATKSPGSLVLAWPVEPYAHWAVGRYGA